MTAERIGGGGRMTDTRTNAERAADRRHADRLRAADRARVAAASASVDYRYAARRFARTGDPLAAYEMAVADLAEAVAARAVARVYGVTGGAIARTVKAARARVRRLETRQAEAGE